MIAVSYDSGLRAARELTGQPVLALTEASLLTALTLGTRVGLVIWGRGATSLYLEIIESYGLGSRICGTRRVDHPVPDGPSSEKGLDEAVVVAATELVEHHDAEVVVLMGAVLAGRSALIEQRLPVPVLDGIRCGMPMLEAMVRIAPRPAARGSYAFPGGRASTGLSDELRDQLFKAR
jgi:allantoin racemase